MRTAGIVVAAALGLIGGAARDAHADVGKAWAAAKAGFPEDTRSVISVDIAGVHKAAAFAIVLDKLRKFPEFATTLDTLKDGCKLDPLTAIQGVVVGIGADSSEGAIYLALGGIDRAGVATCIQKVDHDKGTKVAIKQDGNLTQLTEGDDTSYFAWIGKDVVAVSFHPQDKASLLKWIGGKGALAKAAVNPALAKVNKATAAWAAGIVDKELQPGMTAKAAYGAIGLAQGRVSFDVHAVMATSDQATAAATQAQGQLTAAKPGLQQQQPKLGELLDKMTIGAAGTEVVIKASIPEKDLLEAVAPLLSGS